MRAADAGNDVAMSVRNANATTAFSLIEFLRGCTPLVGSWNGPARARGRPSLVVELRRISRSVEPSQTRKVSPAMLAVAERAKHDVRVDVALLAMAKGVRQRTDDFEPELLP